MPELTIIRCCLRLEMLEKFSIIWKMFKIFLSSIICLDLVLEFSLLSVLFVEMARL